MDEKKQDETLVNECDEMEEEAVDEGACVSADDGTEEVESPDKKRADEMTALAQRLQAEFDNYRKRNLDLTKRIREDATVEVLTRFLPLTDVIAQALTMISDENVKKGVVMIQDEITKILLGYGVVEIEAEGQPFDPRLHEAIMQVPAKTEEEKDTVNQVYQKGYKMGDKVIRASKVIINK